MQPIKVHEFAPLLVCFSCLRILIILHSSMLLPLRPCPTSTSPHDAFHIFVLTSSPLSSIFIKGMLHIDTKDCIVVVGWHLNLVFFMDTSTCWNDTTIALEIPHVGSLTLIPIGGSAPLCHSTGHPLDRLKLLYVRKLSSLDDHLKLRITCGTTIWCARYHLYESHLWLSDNLDIPRVRTIMEPLIGYINYNHFLNTYHLHEILCLTWTRLICLSFLVRFEPSLSFFTHIKRLSYQGCTCHLLAI
jgi:hypothetical protein